MLSRNRWRLGKDLRIGLRDRLLGSVGLYVVLLGVVGVFGLYVAQASLAAFDTALQHNVREISILSDVSEALSRDQATALLHVVAETPEDRARYEQQLAELDASVDRLLDEQLVLQRYFADEGDIGRVQSLRSSWHDYVQAREEFLPVSRENRDAEALLLAEPNGPLGGAYQRVSSELSSVQDALEAESHDQLQQSEEQFSRDRNLLLAVLVGVALFGVIFGLSQSTRLVRAIRDVSRAAHKVATGDFSPRLAVTSGDEIESLATSFNSMAANLQQMQEEQRAVQRLKDDFVSMVSHELRTPMNGVIGLTDLLLAGDLQPRERAYAQAVQRSGEVLLAIVNDILDLSKIESGKLRLERIDFDIVEICDEVVASFARLAADKGVDVTFSESDEMPRRVVGDPVRVRQVLTNLVANAVKFTAHGHVRVSATCVTATSEQAVLRFEVADTGAGIPRDALARVFEPFTQAEGSTSRTYGGTGLGLSICKQLIELMDGQIQLESEPGVGTSVSFSLPFAIGTVSATPLNVDEVASELSEIGNGQRILVVEDSPVNQQVAVGMLEQLGYRADVAASGAAALELLGASANYAAILLDCHMPGLDGYETSAEIRRQELVAGRSERVPIIAMTANSMAGDRERCLAAGMNDYLAKPIRLTDFERALIRWAGPGGRANAAPQAVAVLDPSALETLRRLQRPGRPDLLANVLKTFRRGVPNRVAELSAAAEAVDAASIVGVAHALKGDSARIGAREVQQISADMERLARDGRAQEAVALLPVLVDALGRLDEELSACES
jgi:signal transduction histidine kinase/DNA-binding NarL/FixJ family response regulator